MPPKNLNFITGNANKLAEVQTILSSTPVQLTSQNVDLVEIQGTIEEISRDKARRAADAVCMFFLFFLFFLFSFFGGWGMNVSLFILAIEIGREGG